MPVDRQALGEAIAAAVRAKAVEGTSAVNGAALAAAVRCLADHIDALERKIDSSPFRYMGPYQESRTYGKGDFCTHAGSLWHANHATRGRPGDDGSGWQLAVKRGQNGRDAR